jgi:hypothetical protein
MYRFTVGGDDGYRLKVNGAWVVDEWNDHSYQTTTVDVELQSGCSNEIILEFYENGGDARATLEYVPVSVVQACSGSEDASFRGRYYDSTNLTQYEFERNDDVIDFDWGNGSPNESRLGNNTFSIRWDRKVHLPSPGTYRFTMGGDDGVRLRVNGDWVMQDWSNHAYREQSVDIQIIDRCGVDIRMEYYENTGQARVKLDWQKIS